MTTIYETVPTKIETNKIQLDFLLFHGTYRMAKGITRPTNSREMSTENAALAKSTYRLSGRQRVELKLIIRVGCS